MRTTVTLDDDLHQALKQEAVLAGRPFRSVLNDVIRRGLATGQKAPAQPRFRVEAPPGGLLPGIDPVKLNQDEELVAQMHRDGSRR